jgi:ABC-2 type transport system ATP-binding protein
MEYVIEIDNLSKEYKTGFVKKRSVRALDGLSLNVSGGRIFGFLGGNGAGKTTTIKILMGLLFPTSGGARILGHDISDVAVHRRIGYCPENPYFYDYLTGRELMSYFGAIFGLDSDARKRRTEELLSSVGLEATSWDLQLRKYSKGMLQRVGLAQALINDPEIVFLDEPMSGLDPIGRREIRELIASLRTKGKTVFMSTHILSDIEALCDEVAILRRGQLGLTGKLSELLTLEGEEQRFEVTVTNIEAGQLRSSVDANVEERPSGSIVQCDTEFAVENVIATVHKQGGKLVSVQPVRQSLEDLFTRDIK